MKILRQALFISFLVCGVASTGMAQGGRGMGGGQGGSDHGEMFAEIFGKNLAFTATGHTVIESSKKPVTMDMNYAILNGNVRTEMDLTKVSGTKMDAGNLAQMKQMGMDRMVNLFISDKHAAYLMYPGLKAYCELPTKKKKSETGEAKAPKIEKSEIGKETIDGHPCVKYKVTMTDEQGKVTESTIWQATDLKDFPIQTQLHPDDGSTLTVTFKDINQSKPEASLFELPAGFTRYNSIQEMMMQSAMRMMGGMGQ